MTRELWPHQVEALASLRETIGQGVRRIMLSAPTGSGKTVLAAAIIEGAQRKGNRTAFVVSNLSLIDQTIEALYAEGVRDIGVVQADHHMQDWSKPVQIVSIQTIAKRGVYPEAGIVIIDEAHVLHERHKLWMEDAAWKSVPFIGLSATPYTKGLGRYFETLITVSTTKELIAQGVLCPFRVFASGHPDLKDVKVIAGDYHEGQLSDAMQSGTLIADIIDTWKKLWGKDKTLCFAVDCAHAKALQERFIAAGISCGYQDAHTSADERRDIKRKFHSGEYQVVSNVATLTTGTDWDCRCLILARPTKSLALYQQIVGRALRTAEGKDFATILDHTETTQRLGFVTDIYIDKLDDGKPKTQAEKEKETERKAPLPKECPQCTAIVPSATKVCPSCGFERTPGSSIFEREGELIEVSAGKMSKAKPAASMADKQLWYSMLLKIGQERGYKSGWPAAQYRAKFGVWPRGLSETPTEPSPTVRSWVQSRMIAWAKSKRRTKGTHAAQ